MDKYDKQIEKLLKNPSQIHEDWNDWVGIFQCAGDIEECATGCLTQIRSNKLKNDARNLQWSAFTKELTHEIENDERIPFNSYDVKTREQMEVLAEWQRRIDREYRDGHIVQE